MSVTTTPAHGINVGDQFTISAVSGTGADIFSANGRFIATTGTSGTTLNYAISPVLDVETIAGGNINHGILDGGVVDTTAGLSGSLLANDGLGNTRLGGALVVPPQVASLVNAGTVTVAANTGFVFVQNASSIATASVILPGTVANQFSNGFQLEVNFQNPVGAITWTAGAGGSIVNAPTAIATAGGSILFANSGSGVWVRRIMI